MQYMGVIKLKESKEIYKKWCWDNYFFEENCLYI